MTRSSLDPTPPSIPRHDQFQPRNGEENGQRFKLQCPSRAVDRIVPTLVVLRHSSLETSAQASERLLPVTHLSLSVMILAMLVTPTNRPLASALKKKKCSKQTASRHRRAPASPLPSIDDIQVANEFSYRES